MKAIRLYTLLAFFNILAGFAQQPGPKISGPTPFKLFFEKVYLHTDRDYYSTGEDIWFKAYFVNAQSNSLTSTSNNLYVELISPDLKIVSREQVRLENGLGTGDFRLKDSLPGGTYLLRAYTNWMRNYGDDFIFEKKLVISSVKSIAAGAPRSIQSGAPQQQLPNQSVQISFFPEGGSMVEGIKSIVAFKAEDANGTPVKVRGAILSSNHDTVARFSAPAKGMGSFSISPRPGSTYQAVGTDGSGRSFMTALPAALPKGFAIHIAGSDSVNIKVIVSANPQQLSEFKGQEITLAANHGGQTYYSARSVFESGSLGMNIPKKDIPGGITAITLYDAQRKPHCERLVYIPFRDPVKISINTSKPVYKPKERTTVNIKAVDGQGKPVQANLSVAVVDNSIVPDNKTDIESYLLLESEIKGRIDNPAQYFDKANADRLRDMDMLLMTQGWRDFVWRHLIDTAINIAYMPEPGISLSGKLNDRSGNNPIPDAEVTLFANGAEGDKIYLTKTDANGNFFFDGIKLYSGQDIRVSAKDAKGKSNVKISLNPIESKPPVITPYAPLNAPAPLLAAFRNESKKRVAEQKKQSLADTIRLKEVQIRNNRNVTLIDGEVASKFGYPDQIFNITDKDHDYKSLRHFLLTKVDGAMPDDSQDGDGVLFQSQKKKVRPRFIVNRKQDVFQNMQYYELPMDQVEKVTVRHLIGLNQNDVYVIYLNVKPTAFDRPDPGQLTAQVNGYYQARMFYSPKYPTAQGVVRTDMRTTIFWQPNVKTDANGNASISFFNADPKTNIRIVAEGITDKGIPVTGKAAYQVN